MMADGETSAPLTVLSSTVSSVLDTRFAEYAAFAGIDAKIIPICETSGAAPVPPLESSVEGIALSASTLSLIQSGARSENCFLSRLAEQGQHIMIYGFEPNGRHEELVRWVTQGAVTQISAAEGAGLYTFPSASRALTRELAGVSFRTSGPSSHCVFECTAGNEVTNLLEIGGKPVCLRFKRGEGSLFLWGTTALASVQQPLSAEVEEALPYDAIVPALVFLRSSFGDRCWQNPIKVAHFIIDDAFLSKRYGFLDFPELAKSVEKFGYGVTIGFIPWNYLRSKPAIVGLFSALDWSRLKDRTGCHSQSAGFASPRGGSISLCVHGCDHTANEFGIHDLPTLVSKAVLARNRMDGHHARTGLGYEPVMVFPQGRFSTAALRALRCSGYLGAVNTTVLPTDSDGETITLGDTLVPAVDRFSGFPVFPRRYPNGLGGHAADLFLGKPAYVGEHHDFFRNGVKELERLVTELNQIEPALSWPPISCAVKRLHLQRQTAPGTLDVRFFASTFEFQNVRGSELRVRLIKKEPKPDLVRSVRIDDKPVQFKRNGASIEIPLDLSPNQNVTVVVEGSENPPPSTRVHFGLRYRSKVMLRRKLSDFRDNQLARHPGLLTCAKKAVRLLSRT